MPGSKATKSSPTGMDIISGIDFVNRHRPMLRQKFLFTLQNYVFEHHRVYITTDDADLIIQVAGNNRIDWWLDENNNVTTDDFPELIEDFMAYVELCRR